ncbi:Glycosyl transferase family 2 [Salinihabitans flavidus]|uniref:Glycosyl transferase family 2 n=1 Tax=Salinihabitans flavidus TaxID=569882 RepID=A0A1H8QSU8_9RHOB|nr:glycosyltransferase [Salinihabitans flavidus]SEO57369.1 Glycosyl transferase family 2 [Salinihabitans flavidus]
MDQDQVLSVIIPANNEAGTIGPCLSALLGSDGPEGVQIVVVANGCSDATAAEAAGFAAQAGACGWTLDVLDLPEGGKPRALNAGDAAARFESRVYLDADVTVTPDLLPQLAQVLDRADPIFASGRLRIAPARSFATRAYRRIYARVPFMSQGVPGAGLFAVNAAGRARWGAFPQIISDDTFVRLHFTPSERVAVQAPYDWPLAEGPGNLIRVRRRQDAGVAEIARLCPALLENDDKPPLGVAGMARLAARDPVGFAVYAGVAAAVRLTRRDDIQDWSRGR